MTARFLATGGVKFSESKSSSRIFTGDGVGVGVIRYGPQRLIFPSEKNCPGHPLNFSGVSENFENSKIYSILGPLPEPQRSHTLLTKILSSPFEHAVLKGSTDIKGGVKLRKGENLKNLTIFSENFQGIYG